MGKPILMGRKTFDSIGRPLPGRTNIVLTRDPDFRANPVIVASDFAAAKALAIEAANRDRATEIMVIGGAGIYDLAFPHADRIYLTEVHTTVEGDAHFPDFDRKDWVERSREHRRASGGETSDYSFVILDRISAVS